MPFRSHPDNMAAVKAKNAKTTPSLFSKSMAVGLRYFVSSTIDLSDMSMALYIPIPFKAGPPSGKSVLQAVTNEQIFRIADEVQDTRNPVFGFDRKGSYFEHQYQ
jgi:hypothetical protein